MESFSKEEAAADPATETERSSGSEKHVSFGTAEIHKHRMTMSQNPGVSYGIPVELAWDEESSELVPVTSTAHPSALHKLSATARGQIAADHHSRESIKTNQDEVFKVQSSRIKTRKGGTTVKTNASGDDKRESDKNQPRERRNPWWNPFGKFKKRNSVDI